MRRNPASLVRVEVGRAAQRAALSPAAQARGSGDAGGGARKPGSIDPVTGQLRSYGRLGITEFGEPFRLSGV